MCRAYGVAKPDGGTQRAVYVVDMNGRIVYAKPGLPEDSEILAAIETTRPASG